LAKPLIFRMSDGGRNGHHVLWEAAPNAHPVFSGASLVTGWTIFDKQKNIYVANTPPGVDTRQIWVNDRLAHVASIEVPRAAIEFTRQGVTFKGAKYNYLATLPDAERMEVLAIGFFTKRIAPVERVSGQMLLMKQPAWDNNLWGYDTIEKPYHPELAHLYLANALAFLTEPGQWYLDPAKGKLYLCPPNGVDPDNMAVELPRISVLVAIAGTLAEPVRDLTFRGIRFSYTTWLGPSSSDGYASQQSGSFLAGRAAAYPADPIATCSQGCPAFESIRNLWYQMPASVQVSATERVT
jgi:hypothetical protein